MGGNLHFRDVQVFLSLGTSSHHREHYAQKMLSYGCGIGITVFPASIYEKTLEELQTVVTKIV